jgi:hypothetical protein
MWLTHLPRAVLIEEESVVMLRRMFLVLWTVAGLCMLGGCGDPYVLRGKAISGGYGSVLFVGPDDAQLAELGLAAVSISVYRDANRPNQSLFATGRSDGVGEINIPLKGFGVGWMEEQWLIEVMKPGYETLQSVVTLPPAKHDRRILIMLVPGLSVPPKQAEDLWGEYERYR